MGTHPIFESDFDCLTEESGKRMKLFRIVFCSLVALGSAQEADPANGLDALKALTPQQIQALLAAVGQTSDVHVGGSNQEAPLAAGVVDTGNQAPVQSVEVPTEHVVAAPEEPVQANQLPVSETPVEPVEKVDEIALTETPQSSETVASQPSQDQLTELQPDLESLIPTSTELQNDNPLTPVDAPELDERIEDDENDEIRAEVPNEEGANPNEDLPLAVATEKPAEVVVSTNSASVNVTEVPEVTEAPEVAETPQPKVEGGEEKSALDMLKGLAPEDLQKLLAQATSGTSISQELLAGQVDAGQQTLTDEEFGSRATPEQVALDQTTPEVSETLSESETTAAVESPVVSSEVQTPPETFEETAAAETTEVISEEPEIAETFHEEEIEISEPEFIQPVTADIPDVTEETSEETPEETTTEEEELQTGGAWSTSTEDEYVDEFNEEEKLDDYDTLYDDYEEEEDYEDYEGEYSGYSLLDSFDDNKEPSIFDDVADPISDSFENYRLAEERRITEEIEDIEEEFHEQKDAEKANWNFAFFLICFVVVSSAVYYVYNLVRMKFFPKNVSLKEYLTKRWRYWDNDESQTYSLLPENDQDIKQSVSSDQKEEWNNDDW